MINAFDLMADRDARDHELGGGRGVSDRVRLRPAQADHQGKELRLLGANSTTKHELNVSVRLADDHIAAIVGLDDSKAHDWM